MCVFGGVQFSKVQNSGAWISHSHKLNHQSNFVFWKKSVNFMIEGFFKFHMFDFHKLESDRINLNNLNLDSDTPVSKHQEFSWAQ